MATTKHYFKNPVLLGTGTYKFRPYTILSPYVSLTASLTGCTMSPAVSQITRLGTTTLTFVASTNYRLPTSVQVTGATAVSWNENTGKLVIEKPTADPVNVKVAATKISYSITTNLTNVTKQSGPAWIDAGGTATLVFGAAENYELPDTVTVTNATSNWSQETGTLTLSNATASVIVTIEGVYLLKVISAGTYTLKDEPSVTATHAQFPFKTNTVNGTGITVDSTGITYTLASPMGSTKVYTAATKAWALSAYKTIVLDADAHVSEAFNTWWVANVMPKLSTPQNVAVDGKMLSWNAVTDATKYLIKIDGIEAGTTTGGEYDITVNITNGTYSGDTTITDTATITITPDSGYTLPDNITVTGATGAWNKDTGTLSISNPTGDVTVTGVCVAVQTGETWIIDILPDASSGVIANVNFHSNNTFFYGIRIGKNLIAYANEQQVLYAYDKGNGGWTSDIYRTIIFEEPVEDADLLAWLQTNATKQ